MLLRSVFTPFLAARSCVASTSASASFAGSSTSTLWRQPAALQQQQQVRSRSSLTPRRTKYRKAHKGRIPVRTGGSTAGTTLEHGDFGIRVKEPTRLSAKQLHSASEALRRGIKPIKGARLYTRVFPDIPVCIKVGCSYVDRAAPPLTLIRQGNETRMGKGKGTFEYWACRASVGKVIFEIGGGGIAEQVAKDGKLQACVAQSPADDFIALRLASAKLPVTTEFITRSSLPRVGSMLVTQHSTPQNQGVNKPAAGLIPEDVLLGDTAVPTA